MTGPSESEKMYNICTGVKAHVSQVMQNEAASGGQSIKPFCVDGAVMQCTLGSASAALIVIDHGVAITGKYAAHDEDRVPFTNIPPFGMCSATGKPCVPATIPKWLLTNEFNMITNKNGGPLTSGEECTLTMDSILICTAGGGIIKFNTSGQMITVGELLTLLATLLAVLQKIRLQKGGGKTPPNTGLWPSSDSVDSKKTGIVETIQAVLKEIYNEIFPPAPRNGQKKEPSGLSMLFPNNDIRVADLAGTLSSKKLIKSLILAADTPIDLVKGVFDTLPDGSVTTGYGLSGSLSFWSGQVSIMISASSKGDVSLAYGYSGSITSGELGASISKFSSISNNPSIGNGVGVFAGGSIPALLGNLGLEFGPSYNLAEDMENNVNQYWTLTGNVVLGVETSNLSPEVHAAVYSESIGIINKNIFDEWENLKKEVEKW